MKLHKAIENIVTQFGIKTLSEKRFLNLLSDFLAFEDFPATQEILKSLVADSQYTDFINRLELKQSKALIASCADKTKTEFQKATKFKRELVAYIFDSILLCCGYLDKIKEPHSSGYDAHESQQTEILNNLREQLNELKHRYTTLLNESAVIPDDIVFQSAPYYFAETRNQLYAIELQIDIISEHLGLDKDWCKNNFNKKIAKFESAKINAVKSKLDFEKNNYINELEASIVHPSKSYIPKPAYIDDSRQSILDTIETNIKALYAELGEAYDDFCETQRESILNKYTVTSFQRNKAIALKIVTPAILLIISIFTGTSYTTSLGEIEEFNTTIAIGKTEFSSGNYLQASQTFIQAQNNYDGTFFPSYYKGVADDEIDKCIVELENRINLNIANEKYFDAKNCIAQLPPELLNSDRMMANIPVWNDKIAVAVPLGIESLIRDISANGGTLSTESHTKLDELLQLEPQNYWLNLLKNKHK